MSKLQHLPELSDTVLDYKQDSPESIKRDEAIQQAVNRLPAGKRSSESAIAELQRVLPSVSPIVRIDGLWATCRGVPKDLFFEAKNKASSRDSSSRNLEVAGINFSMKLAVTNDDVANSRDQYLELINQAKGFKVLVLDPRSKSFKRCQDEPHGNRMPYALKIELSARAIESLGDNLVDIYNQINAISSAFLEHGLTLVGRLDVAVDLPGVELWCFSELANDGHILYPLMENSMRRYSDNSVAGDRACPGGIMFGESYNIGLCIYDRRLKTAKMLTDKKSTFSNLYKEDPNIDPSKPWTRLELRMGYKYLKRTGSFGDLTDLKHLFKNLDQLIPFIVNKVKMTDKPYNKKNPKRNSINPVWKLYQESIIAWAQTHAGQWKSMMPVPVGYIPRLKSIKARVDVQQLWFTATTRINNTIATALQRFGIDMNDPATRAKVFSDMAAGTFIRNGPDHYKNNTSSP